MTKSYPQIAINDFIVFPNKAPLLFRDNDNSFLRKKNINFHIKSGDYFGTLATVIDLIRQEKEKIEGKENKILKDLKEDLFYLQKNYKIIKKK